LDNIARNKRMTQSEFHDDSKVPSRLSFNERLTLVLRVINKPEQSALMAELGSGVNAMNEIIRLAGIIPESKLQEVANFEMWRLRMKMG